MHLNNSTEGESVKFCFVISTRRLIRSFIGLQNICIDATYQLSYQDYPLVVVGTVDAAKKFHPLCFACTTNETAADFEFLQFRRNSIDFFTVLENLLVKASTDLKDGTKNISTKAPISLAEWSDGFSWVKAQIENGKLI